MTRTTDGVDPKLIVSTKRVPRPAARLIDPLNGTQEATEAREVEKRRQHDTNLEASDVISTASKRPAESDESPSGMLIAYQLTSTSTEQLFNSYQQNGRTVQPVNVLQHPLKISIPLLLKK